MKKLDLVVIILLILGGLNWGLVGVLSIDLVATVFGDMTMAARVVYGLIGVAAVMKTICVFRCCCCGDSCKTEG